MTLDPAMLAGPLDAVLPYALVSDDLRARLTPLVVREDTTLPGFTVVGDPAARVGGYLSAAWVEEFLLTSRFAEGT
jgi:hypothetical protein